MKLLLTRAVVGTALVFLAVVLATFVMPPEALWLPQWLATRPGEAPDFTTTVLLVAIVVVLRLGYAWRVRDFASAFLLADIIFALSAIRIFGSASSAFRADFIIGTACLAAGCAVGLLIAAALRAMARSGRHKRGQVAAPKGGLAVLVSSSNIQEGRHR
jgi:hypothetical protein